MASRPVFRHDRAGELVQVSFNNADRAPFLLPAPEMEQFYDALRAFEALANDHRLQWRRVNPPGDAMLFDNWRVLHGRTAYTGHRHLCGAYVNHEDYESRLRLAMASAYMSENLRRYTTIMFGFEHVLRLVPDSAWSNPSPCEEWNARQVAGHAMSVVNNIAARGGVGTVVDAFGDVAAFAGDDPLATFRGIRDRYLEATDRHGALQTRITSSLGEMTLDEYLGRMCADTLIHTWDVARAARVDDTLDPGAVCDRAGRLPRRRRPGAGARPLRRGDRRPTAPPPSRTA